MMCQKVLSGGQTGVDRAVLDVALETNFPCSGYCPEGRLAEDGTIPSLYPLAELKGGDYAARTRKNIEESDGTLIIFADELKGGTMLTYEISSTLNKPLFLLQVDKAVLKMRIDEIQRWIGENNILTLNVAGPRLSEWEKGYEITKSVMDKLLKQLRK